MAIVEMKRLKLLGMRKDREDLMHMLQRAGCVEITEPTLSDLDSQNEDQSWMKGMKRPENSALSKAQQDFQRAEYALNVLKRQEIKVGGMLTPRFAVKESDLFGSRETAEQEQAVEKVLEGERRIQELEAERIKLMAEEAALRPWVPLDINLDLKVTKNMWLQLGTLIRTTPLEEVVQAVSKVSDMCQLTLSSQDKDVSYVLAVCHTSVQEDVLQVLRDFGWSAVTVRGVEGTAKENTQRIERRLLELGRELDLATMRLKELGNLVPVLKKASDRAAVEVNFEENRSRLLDTEETFLLQGWIPAEQWHGMEGKLSAYTCAWEVQTPKREEYGSVPVRLANNPITGALNAVTEMYSLPRYGSVDPNPWMAPFFILFYGIMMADMGYGLLMILGALFIMKKAKPIGGLRNFCVLLGLCGVSTFVVGAMTASFFGDFIPQLLKIQNPESTFVWFWPPLFTPLNDTIAILLASMALGLIQIVVGMFASFLRKVREGRFMDALWEEVTWWVVFAGGGLMAANITPLVLYVGLAMVVLGPVLTQKGAGKVVGIFASLYNHVTGYFGDILSYSRLMALMLAGSVIAQVFNTLGAITGVPILYVVIALAGNMLNFALNLLGCYVHDLRLQCLEYFNKFYEDGGKAFTPMAQDTKYCSVT